LVSLRQLDGEHTGWVVRFEVFDRLTASIPAAEVAVPVEEVLQVADALRDTHKHHAKGGEPTG
jgi:hypothetical protein